jgi:hypothetical protein
MGLRVPVVELILSCDARTEGGQVHSLRGKTRSGSSSGRSSLALHQLRRNGHYWRDPLSSVRCL